MQGDKVKPGNFYSVRQIGEDIKMNLSMARGEPGHRLSVPGSAWYVWMPDDLSPSDAARMQSWVNFVLVPQLKFIAGDVDTGGGDGV